MSECQYFRVNISTATSERRVNELGQQYAEVLMNLPANLISLPTERIKSVRAAVMKMQIPLAEVPVSSIPVRDTISGNEVETTGYIGVLPYHLSTSNEGNLLIPNSNSLIVVPLLRRMRAYVYKNAIKPGYDKKEIMMKRHDFENTAEFLDFLNRNLQESYTIPTYSKPEMKFVQKSDNTISLIVRPLQRDFAFVPWFTKSMVYEGRTRPDFNSRIFKQALTGSEQYKSYQLTESFFIYVNEEIYKKLPSLPWMKVHRDNIQSASFLAQYDEDYLYVLNTLQANMSFRKGENVFIGGYQTDTIEYNFVQSDAVSTTSISSIILTMDGASFTEQVYPVNFSVTTKKTAQTTTVPILEVYYPMWTRPSDMTTTMIIARDSFENAAPVKINPYMLKERNLKFKLHYITTEGEMREMYIPLGVPFNFQLCFAIETY